MSTTRDHTPIAQRFEDLCQRLGHLPVVRAFEATRAKIDSGSGGEADSERGITFVVSSPGTKRDGNEVVQDGWQLENYRANPVVLWSHRRDMLPIGTSQWEQLMTVRGKGGKCLVSRSTFCDADLMPFADQVYQLYQRGMLNAVSAGWMPMEYEYRKDGEGYITGIRFTKNDLMEYSCCAVPADPQALQRAFQGGLLRTDQQADFALSAMLNTDEVAKGEILYLGGPNPEREAKLIVDMATAPQTAQRSEPTSDDEPKETTVTIPWKETTPFRVAAQRLQQGFYKVSEADLPALRALLTPKFTEAGHKAPWERALGAAYEQLHSALSGENEEADRTVLRQQAVQLAVQLYGTDRTAEPWEDRFERLGKDTIWPVVAQIVDVGLARAGLLEDLDARDEQTAKVIDRLRTVLEVHEAALGVVRDLCTITETTTSDELVDVVEAMRQRELDEQYVRTEGDAVAESCTALEALLGTTEGQVRVQKDEENDDSSQTVLTVEEELRKLFSDVVSA